MLNIWRDHLHI